MYWSRWIDVCRAFVRSLFERPKVEDELDREVRFHLDQQIAENLAAGMGAEEARRAAVLALGGVTQIEEGCREMRRTNYVEELFRDLKFALRTLLANPVFALVLILTMALSIGANTAIFSVIHGVLLRTLPYPKPDSLVRLFLSVPEYPKFPINPNDFHDYRDRAHSFESMAAYTRYTADLSGDGNPQRLSGFLVTSGFFHVLGVSPLLGREFTRTAELPGPDQEAILSNRLWRSRFGGKTDIIGRKIVVAGSALTVVGVMPPGFEHPGNMYHAVAYGDTVDIWIPLKFDGHPENRGSHFLDCVARLKPGVSAGRAQGDINGVMSQMAREHEGDQNWKVMVIPLKKEITGSSQRLLLVLAGAAGALLAIACVNAANLLLARASVRQREMALRSALGAGKSRLIRQVLTESALISLIGAGIGCVVAVVGVKALVSLLPADFPRATDIHVDGMMFVFALVVSVGTGLLFGLAPAFQCSRTDLVKPLHEAGRSTTSGAGTLRLRDGLVVCEVALACLLAIGAGLMLRSFVNLLQTPPGFDPQHVLTADISLPDVRYNKPELGQRFFDKLAKGLGSRQGVQLAGVASDLPWTGYDDNAGGFTLEGRTPPPGQFFHARYHMASADYFPALGIPLMHGRFFNQHDTTNERHVVIINRAMAMRYWHSEDVVGHRMTFADKPKDADWMTIVGVVGDVKDTPASDGAEPAFWWPLLQAPFGGGEMSIVMRGPGEPTAMTGTLRAVARELDSDIAVSDIVSMEQVAAASYSASRFALFLIGLFAVLALTLAAIGTYGIMSYSVNQRNHEFGVRMALGASAREVLASVVVQGMRLAAVGVVLGVICGLSLSRVVAGLLYGIKANDPATIGVAALVIIAASMLACLVPARRATKSDPMQVLRAE